MFYRTRVMVAAADFLHGADLLRKGDTFVATPIDADYLHSHGRATFAPEPQIDTPKIEAAAPAPAPAAAPAPAPAVERTEAPDTAATDTPAGRPDALQDAGAPTTDHVATDVPVETAASSAEATAPAPASTRRRGRTAQNTASE